MNGRAVARVKYLLRHIDHDAMPELAGALGAAGS
jgi:signal transduction protein with GAF and PtsI domain